MVQYRDIEINELDTGGELPHAYVRGNSTVHQGPSNVLGERAQSHRILSQWTDILP